MAKAPYKQPPAATGSGLIRVTLAAPHVHDGQPLRRGDTLTVTPARADWLRRHGLIDPTLPDNPNPGE